MGPGSTKRRCTPLSTPGTRRGSATSLRAALATKQSILSSCGEMDCFAYARNDKERKQLFDIRIGESVSRRRTVKRPSRPLAGAGGVGLQRADAFGERPAFGNAAMGGRGAVGGRRRFGQDRLDRRVRPFDLHRELGDFGGDVVDAFAQQ